MAMCSVVTVSDGTSTVECVKVKPGCKSSEIHSLLDKHPAIQSMIYSPKGDCDIELLREFLSKDRKIKHLAIKTKEGSIPNDEVVKLLRDEIALSASNIVTGIRTKTSFAPPTLHTIYVGRKNFIRDFFRNWRFSQNPNNSNFQFCTSNCSLTIQCDRNWLNVGKGCTAAELIQTLAKFPDVKEIIYAPTESWDSGLLRDFLQKNRQIKHLSTDTEAYDIIPGSDIDSVLQNALDDGRLETVQKGWFPSTEPPPFPQTKPSCQTVPFSPINPLQEEVD